MLTSTVLSNLKREEKYAAPVDRISGNSNGIIQIKGNIHINLGEMNQSKVGKVVTFTYKGGSKGTFSKIGKETGATLIEDVDFDNWEISPSSSSSTDRSNPVRQQAGSKNNLLNGNQ